MPSFQVEAGDAIKAVFLRQFNQVVREQPMVAIGLMLQNRDTASILSESLPREVRESLSASNIAQSVSSPVLDTRAAARVGEKLAHAFRQLEEDFARAKNASDVMAACDRFEENLRGERRRWARTCPKCDGARTLDDGTTCPRCEGSGEIYIG